MAKPVSPRYVVLDFARDEPFEIGAKMLALLAFPGCAEIDDWRLATEALCSNVIRATSAADPENSAKWRAEYPVYATIDEKESRRRLRKLPTRLRDRMIAARLARLYFGEAIRKGVAVGQRYPDLRRAVLTQAKAFGARIVLIEDAASGASLLQDLRSELSSVRGCKPTGDKVMRMNVQTAHIENGFVYLPTAAPWLLELVHELTMFPKGRYADQVDSISQALEYIFTQTGAEGWVEYYRGMAEAQKPLDQNSAGPPRSVRAVSNQKDVTLHVNGRDITLDANGIFWITEQEAQTVCGIAGMRILPRGEA